MLKSIFPSGKYLFDLVCLFLFLGLCFSCTKGTNGNNETLDNPSKVKIDTFQTQLANFLDQQYKLAKNDTSSNETISRLEQAIDSTQSYLFPDILLAKTYYQLAIHYYQENNYKGAVAGWQQAIANYQQLDSIPHYQIVKAFRNIGNSYLEDFNGLEAKKAFQAAISQVNFSNIEDKDLIIAIYNGLGRANYLVENFSEAEKYLTIAKIQVEDLYKNEPWKWRHIYYSFFEYYQKKRTPLKMLKIAKELTYHFEKIEEKELSDSIIIANSYNNQAMAYQELKQLKKATIAYSKSIHINQQLDRKRALAQNYNNLSESYLNLKQYEKAINSINLAIKYYQQLDIKIDLAKSIATKAKILFEKNQVDTAWQLLITSNQLLKPNGTKIALDPIALIENFEDQILIKKYLAKKEGIHHLHDAVQLFDKLRPLLHQVRTQIDSDASKLFFTNKAKSIFSEVITLYTTIYEQNRNKKWLVKAFELVDDAKATILNDAFRKANLNRMIGVPETILNKEQTLLKQLANIEVKLYEQPEDSVALLQQYLGLTNQIDQLKEQLAVNYPNYFKRRYQNTTFSIQSISGKLKGSLLQYFATDSLIYAFVYQPTTDSLSLTKIRNSSTLKSQIQQLRRSIYTPFIVGGITEQEKNNYRDTFITTAHQLYQTLIEPLEQQSLLKGPLKIIPDDVLNYIPFDLLLDNKVTSDTTWYQLPYLLENYQISYSPSISTFIEMQDKKINPSASFLGFAPIFYGDTTKKHSVEAIREGLNELKYNRQEVLSLQEQLGGTVFINQEATLNNFKKMATQFGILHLATHGKAKENRGDFAWLAFTSDSTKQSYDLLYNRDLYALNFQAEMVVLSACETGIGELQKGEGVISLARGFSYAGAKSIIPSLWNVNDQQTSNLMLYFYKNLQAGLPKDVALNEAKKAYIREYKKKAHPFFWAAFVPIGDMQPIHFEKNYPCVWLIGLLFLVGIGYYFYQKQRKERSSVK